VSVTNEEFILSDSTDNKDKDATTEEAQASAPEVEVLEAKK
jgi:hypothetical protein